MRSLRLSLVPAIALLAGCHRESGNPAPPRLVEAALPLPRQSSTIVVPVTASLDAVAAGLNEAVPRTLWTIDRHEDACVKAKRVDIGIAKVKVLPNLGCRIVGRVTRGRIAVSGSGERLVVTLPVSAAVRAERVGGVVSETATGTATVRGVARLTMGSDWTPRAKLAIDYDWKVPPGVDVLGKRITFVDKADAKLAGVVARLERELPQQLRTLQIRRQLDAAWRRAFTSIELSRDNPPAWMRVTPQRIGFGGYRIEGRRLRLILSTEALTETFVGARPPDPVATPLPPPARPSAPPGLRFFVPVLADYAQLEPVVQRTLRKLAARGITLKGIGPVDATFGDVTVYATAGNRLAVGVKASVKPRGGGFGTTRGEVWLTALPRNEPGSQFVRATDVRLAARTDSAVVDTLIALFSDAGVQATIAGALQHDFAPDYRKVLAKAQAAIGSRREGDFVLSARITGVENGEIRALGAGLFLPVRASGEATIAYRPR